MSERGRQDFQEYVESQVVMAQHRARRRSAGRRAVWGDEGEPLNVEAAIADAMEWLEVLRLLRPIQRSAENAQRLDAAMAALASYGDNTLSTPTPEPEEAT